MKGGGGLEKGFIDWSLPLPSWAIPLFKGVSIVSRLFFFPAKTRGQTGKRRALSSVGRPLDCPSVKQTNEKLALLPRLAAGVRVAIASRFLLSSCSTYTVGERRPQRSDIRRL